MKRALGCALLYLLCAAFEWPGRVEQLTHQAAHGEPAARREAIQQLASYPSDATRAAVLKGLDDADVSVRLEAASTAGKLRLKTAAPALIDWLGEPDAAMRHAAARALGLLNDPAAAAPLARLLGDNDATLRGAAVDALASLGGSAVVTPLLDRLDDPTPQVRLRAVEGLGKLGDTQAVVGLLGRVDDPAIEVRIAVLAALGALGDARAVDSASRALSDPLEDVRLAAAASLGRLGAASSVPALEQALTHADGRLASALLAALGSIDSDAARATLLRSLGAAERSVQASAALAESARRFDLPPNTPRALPAVIAELATERDPARLEALANTLFALSRFQPIGAATEPLLARLTGEASPVPALVRALAATRDQRALLPLLERLGQATEPLRGVLLDGIELYFEQAEPEGLAADPLLQVLPQVEAARQPQVVRLLGRIGEARALPTLRPLLDSSSPALHRAAVEALGAIGDPQSVPALLQRLGARDAELRRLSALALASSGDAAVAASLLERLREHDGVDPLAVILALGKLLATLDANKTLDPAIANRALRALGTIALGRDEAQAARALRALAEWHPAGSGRLLGEVLRYPSSRRRYQASLTLGALPASESQAVLRFLLRSSPRRLLPAAILALGEVGDANDAPKLLKLAVRYPWPVPVATSYALGRMARRGVLRGAAAQEQLCSLGASREPYVRANVAAGLAALGARPCDGGPDPLQWLAAEHAPAVRVAAARWTHAALARERIDAAQARQALARCARGEQDPAVARACREAEPPPTARGAELTALGGDGNALLADRLVAVRLPDGLVFVARTDVNAELHLPDSSRGPVLLEDPALTPLEPAAP